MTMKLRNFATVLVLLSACTISLYAQTNSPDYQSTVHVFPRFVDGAIGGGKFYVSTLQVSATDFTATTWCTFSLLAMPARKLTDIRGVVGIGTLFNIALVAGGWQILQSAGEQPLAAGGALLQCDAPVTAHLIYSVRSDGVTESESTVSAAPTGTVVQIVADQRREARLGLSIANPYWQAAVYRISIVDMNARVLYANFIRVEGGGTFSRFIDEIATLPSDFRGVVLLESYSGIEVYASALRFTGVSFTAIPAMVRVR